MESIKGVPASGVDRANEERRDLGTAPNIELDFNSCMKPGHFRTVVPTLGRHQNRRGPQNIDARPRTIWLLGSGAAP